MREPSVEAGAINLDAPVTTYLPWFRTAAARRGPVVVEPA
ncbi:MAG: beta-lactamase family protein [Chloroflexales bacterium]|nr:beta-lactamase family protein [Chloroflexales bacterium]